MAIKLLVDSASDINLNEAENLEIYLLPMEINFGDEQYLDGVEITPDEFYNKLTNGDVIPKTSQINQFRFQEKFEELTKDGSEVLCITMSSKLSGTFDNAKSIAKNFNGKVRVIDSLNVTIGERILINYAINLIKEQLTLDEIEKELNDKKTKIQLVALVDTLEYLQKGGRLSKVASVAGTILKIKPVISIIEGEVKVIGKAIGSKKGNNMLIQQIETYGGIDFEMPYMTGYSGSDDNLLKIYLEDSKALWEGKSNNVPVHIIGSTIGTHAGPGAVAVAFFSNK